MESVLSVYQRSYHPDFPLVCLDETLKQLVKVHNAYPVKSQLKCLAHLRRHAQMLIFASGYWIQASQ